MTAAKLQRIAAVLSNHAWTRHWLNYYGRHDDVEMAIQCIDHRGVPQRICDAERDGFVEGPDFIYTIKRTNEDGSPFISNHIF